MFRPLTSTFPALTSFTNALSAGALQLLEQKGTRWLQRADSEILEKGRDDLLIDAINREPAHVEGRLEYLAQSLLRAEESLRGFPTFSAIYLRPSPGSVRLPPTRLPWAARHLAREVLQREFETPGALHLVASGDSADDFVEGLLVYLCLLPLEYARPLLSMEALLPERNAHLEAHRRPPLAGDWPYRASSMLPISEERLQAWRWISLDPPWNKRWVSLPPHKILKVDEDRRSVEILIAEREQPEYEIIWHPAQADWEAMAKRSFFRRKLEWDQGEFSSRFDAAYRVHETLRPLEIALEGAMMTHQACIGRREENGPVGDLARLLREELYDFLHRQGSGGDFLDDWGKNLQLMESARMLAGGWLPRIRQVLGGRL